MENTRETWLLLEPFAMGFKEADTTNIAPEYRREYRIAAGNRKQMEHIRLHIDPKDWFAGPCGRFPDQGIRYNRGNGIFHFAPDDLERRCREYPELAEEFKKLYGEFDHIRTDKIAGGTLRPDQHERWSTKACWGAGAGHANPDYEMLLRLGTDGIREKIKRFRKINVGKDGFYDALELALSALDVVGKRYRELALAMLPDASAEDAVILKRIADALSVVPQKTPRNFFEACQFFWLAFSFIDTDSPGNFDQFMKDYYLPDDKADRYECLRHLWELFHRTRTWNLCIGGSDEFGNDLCNDLTYDVLRVAREFKYETPNLTMRFHKNSPDRAWRAAAETLATGIGMPAIYNDDVVCPALESLGIPASDSHKYCMNGCNQIDIFGKSHMGLEDGEFCVAKALEYALFNGEDQYNFHVLGLETGEAKDFPDYESFKRAFLQQCDFLVDQVVEISNHIQQIFAKEAPNPWMSCVIQGCIEKGQDYKNHGPFYGHGQILTEGLPDAVDSLAAIKHYVYDTGKYAMSDLVKALKANFEGYEDLYRDFSTYHKFGNNIEDVDAIYAEVSDHIYEYARTKKTFRGGYFGMGCSTFNRSADYGIHLGALPNGKRRGESTLGESIGPVPGCDTNGPTAMLNSVLKCNQYLATSGNVLQMKFIKRQFETEEGMNAYIALAKTYFRLGGQTLQINVVSQEELLDAVAHPDKHQNLIVRVGGFSAYFVRLDSGLQENIIKRTQMGF